MFPTFKETPNAKDEEGDKEVGGEVLQADRHLAGCAWG